jgi:hypothetical protein
MPAFTGGRIRSPFIQDPDREIMRRELKTLDVDVVV